MPVYVALIRAVNVRGNGKVPKQRLIETSSDLRYSAARTFLASGNALFTSCDPEAEFRIKLERQLQKYSGRPVRILVRSGDELADLCSRNPFPGEPTDRVRALFTDGPLPSDPLEGVIGIHDERVCLGRRELFILSCGAGKYKTASSKHAHWYGS